MPTTAEYIILTIGIVVIALLLFVILIWILSNNPDNTESFDPCRRLEKIKNEYNYCKFVTNNPNKFSKYKVYKCRQYLSYLENYYYNILSSSYHPHIKIFR